MSVEARDIDNSTPRPMDSPIRVLPPEILAEIFERCTISEDNAPVLLSHVSVLWRRTALTTPCLWRSISARLPSRKHLITSSRVRAWLARSGVFPLNVSLVLSDSNRHNVDFILGHIRDHVSHLNRFSLIASSTEIAWSAVMFLNWSCRFDMLSRIDITIGHPQSDLEDFMIVGSEFAHNDITNVFMDLMKAHAPRLVEFNMTTPVLPHAARQTERWAGFPHLRTLRIFENGIPFEDISALSVLSLLARCPALEFFSFRGSYLFDPHGIPGNIVCLPHLRELHLAQTIHQRIILSSLTTPSLEILRLSWLNRPEMLVDEFYAPDESENGEEPTEFSQSPYTDLLTGAGIRSLIKRSVPPIRVLDMDFADARSPRDFVWLFDHLPTLESFRIVGSDMSDRVLFALASKRKDGAWLCPRLTSLEFSRCDQMTGRGVVALAKGRNPAIDDSEVVTPEAHDERPLRPARLKRFIVDGCAQVDCESVAVMQHMLGDVNFEVEVVPSYGSFLSRRSFIDVTIMEIDRLSTQTKASLCPHSPVHAFSIRVFPMALP